ncbi:MAG: HEPN domain-containing protein [Bacteroidota bacterium]
MKTSLAHLPEKKQEEIMHVTSIIREVINPEKIILFGSYAKGTFKETQYWANGILYEYISDYDFLVVTVKNQEKTYVQEGKVMDRSDRYKPPVNLEIHEVDYINKGLEVGEYFFVDIVKEGILLYDTGNIEFVEPRELSGEEKKLKAQRYFDTWFPQGGKFLKTAEFNFRENEYKLGAFLLHQAAESLYYAVLLVFTDYKPKTHNLWKLRKKTKPFSEELFSVFRAETDKLEDHLFDLLKRGYVDARYRIDYAITKEELATLIDRIAKMIPIVERICKDKIEAL